MMTGHVEIIRRLSAPLEPEPTGIEPHLPRLDGLRCIAFDIYGTLFISGSGDLGVAAAEDREEALRAALAGAGVADPPPGMVAALHERIRAHHTRAHAAGVPHPEIEIRDVWAEVVAALGHELPRATVERLAITYECAVNPVWPMPGLGALLDQLRGAGVPLAIVSNAQFFTPLLFDAFLGAPPAALGFPADLSFWSFEHGRAKPDRYLFDALAAALARRGIRANETLYLGNDMRNDIGPAAGAGFRTALFAGDRRSLRLREPDHIPARPEAVVTRLDQLTRGLRTWAKQPT